MSTLTLSPTLCTKGKHLLPRKILKRELQIKGLLGELKGMEENGKNEFKTSHENHYSESEPTHAANRERSYSFSEIKIGS